jgi:hypothetical protein
MLQASQSHLPYGSVISAITKQQVEADQEGQRVGQYAQQHAFYGRRRILELLK